MALLVQFVFFGSDCELPKAHLIPKAALTQPFLDDCDTADGLIYGEEDGRVDVAILRIEEFVRPFESETKNGSIRLSEPVSRIVTIGYII